METDSNIDRLLKKMTLNSSSPPIVLKDNDCLAQYVNFSGKTEVSVIHSLLLSLHSCPLADFGRAPFYYSRSR